MLVIQSRVASFPQFIKIVRHFDVGQCWALGESIAILSLSITYLGVFLSSGRVDTFEFNLSLHNSKSRSLSVCLGCSGIGAGG